jgi:hypothetical protein
MSTQLSTRIPLKKQLEIETSEAGLDLGRYKEQHRVLCWQYRNPNGNKLAHFI